MVLMEVMLEETTEGSVDGKLKVLVHFLRVKRYWRVTSPPPHALFSIMLPIKNLR
jgi:uncharacterized protein YqcC (DUF446 family)